ncbi:hypothetical protein E0701_06465 [Lactobacillus helveticus]|nr:hypothetical protein [Lactobacillus helveticus]
MKMPIIRVDADHPNELVDPSAYSHQINFVVKYDGAGELTPKDNVQTIDFKRTVTASPITGKRSSKMASTPLLSNQIKNHLAMWLFLSCLDTMPTRR